ncbi:c-type cytochrome biogenesis protein CcmI [Muricoccus vinaceus]|uniref:C-type cytochrome biogenesis protein CcmI n=1 Tax=Muricoccus vinaceus TaxID=424704 RepID=A0ABV6IMY6_9PROT
MTWLLAAALALAALLPLAWTLWRPAPVQDRGAADRALYRAQIAELERDRSMGRLDEAAHAAALLEVQRRMLAVPEPRPARSGGRAPLVAGLVFVPALAFGLYVLNGVPGMPSATFAERSDAAARDERLLAQLRARLTAMPPGSPAARQGWLLMADAQRNRGKPAEAAAAYVEILRGGFDPEIAAQLAQVLIESRQFDQAIAFLADALPLAPGHVGLRFLSGLAEAQAGRPEQARAAWTALLASAPEDAPWKTMVQRRMEALP